MTQISASFSTPSSDVQQLLDLLAFVYLENDRPDKALVLLLAIEASSIADAGSLLRQAVAYLRTGRPEAALDTLDRMAMRGSIDAAFHLVRAQTLLALGRREHARSAMAAYIEQRASASTTAALAGAPI